MPNCRYELHHKHLYFLLIVFIDDLMNSKRTEERPPGAKHLNMIVLSEEKYATVWGLRGGCSECESYTSFKFTTDKIDFNPVFNTFLTQLKNFLTNFYTNKLLTLMKTTLIKNFW